MNNNFILNTTSEEETNTISDDSETDSMNDDESNIVCQYSN